MSINKYENSIYKINTLYKAPKSIYQLKICQLVQNLKSE